MAAMVVRSVGINSATLARPQPDDRVLASAAHNVLGGHALLRSRQHCGVANSNKGPIFRPARGYWTSWLALLPLSCWRGSCGDFGLCQDPRV